MIIKTRVLIISDTHCAPLTQSDWADNQPYPPFKAPLPSADLLIHCGDLTHIGKSHEYEATLDMLKEIDAPVKLVIAGNHDISLDRDYILSHMGRSGAGGAWRRIVTRRQAESMIDEVRDLCLGPTGRAAAQGVTLLEEGLHLIDLPNGARIQTYASPYTPAFMDFGFAYEKHEDRFNESKNMLTDAMNIAANAVPAFSESKAPIDICITHGPPLGRLDQTKHGVHAGCPHLVRAMMRARPLIHCFGHIHEGWGAQRVTWTDEVDKVVHDSATIADWQEAGCEAGIAENGTKFETLEVDLQSAKEQHGVFIDVSKSGGTALSRGGETLFVNAAVMDVRYDPKNAPWIIDLDLPKA